MHRDLHPFFESYLITKTQLALCLAPIPGVVVDQDAQAKGRDERRSFGPHGGVSRVQQNTQHPADNLGRIDHISPAHGSGQGRIDLTSRGARPHQDVRLPDSLGLKGQFHASRHVSDIDHLVIVAPVSGQQVKVPLQETGDDVQANIQFSRAVGVAGA